MACSFLAPQLGVKDTPFVFHLNNRVLLSKALAYMKFEHQISEGTYHIGPETEGLFCFYCTTLNFVRMLSKGGTRC